jgi:UTP--glucose-1-phosphate uridylyltransferase
MPKSTPLPNPTLEQAFAPFAHKMAQAGLPQLVIDNFRHAYARLFAGDTGYIGEEIARPVTGLHTYAELPENTVYLGEAALEKTVICKLNGGLGTSMGLDGPKSLLPVKDGLTFLNVTAQQVMHLRREHGTRLPLLLMNSFTTHAASLAALAQFLDFVQDLPLGFVQNKAPKVAKDGLAPIHWPADPDKEWCPPGHGDIYPSLMTTGLLEDMLRAGYEYLFVSNADNLGAVLDTRILGFFASAGVPFLMEVAERTPADSKGGHLARRPDGQLILRESAQCPPEEMASFQDIERYGYFNTNNLWIHLPSLHEALHHTRGVLDLPLIRNEKPVDPTQPDSPRVFQLETAMGSAISIFAGAQALVVPRSRFAPVKKNSDLLVLWSDAYELTDDYQMRLAPARAGVAPIVTLDDNHYGLLADMRLRFPHGAPSLLRCRTLTVEGDVRFGRDVTVMGDVVLHAAAGEVLEVADGARLAG